MGDPPARPASTPLVLPELPHIPPLPESLRVQRMANPFGPRPGESPPYLAGRAWHIEQWARPVHRMLESGRVSPPIFYTAPRGLGKTVLLRQLHRDAEVAGFLCVWVTASKSESLIKVLVAGLKASILATWAGAAADLVERLDSIKVTAGLPGIFAVEGSTRPQEKLELAFATEMTNLSREIVARGSRGVMLFVDELHAAPRADLDALVPALQEWTSGMNGSPLLLVGSGPIQLSRVLAASGGFAERFQYVPLERLSDMESMLAFSEGMPKDFQWLPGALDRAVEAAEGHPYVVQLIGHFAWELTDASEVSRPFFRVADVDLAIAAASEEIRRVFQGRWIETPDRDRRVLGAIAKSDSGRLSRAQIARQAELTSREADEVVDGLYADGWLDVDGLEQVRLALPGIGQFVTQRHD